MIMSGHCFNLLKVSLYKHVLISGPYTVESGRVVGVLTSSFRTTALLNTHTCWLDLFIVNSYKGADVQPVTMRSVFPLKPKESWLL